LAAEVTSMLAAISIFIGEPDPSLAERALKLAEKVHDPVITGMAHLGSGLAFSSSDSAKARQMFEQGLEATAESGDRLIEYLLLGAVGELYYAAGEKASARKRYVSALNLAHELGFANPLYQANLGLIMLDEGDVFGAVSLLRDCLRAGRHSTVQQSMAPVTDLAHCAVILGACAIAARMYGFADHMAAGKGLTFVEMDDLRRGDHEEMKRVLGHEGLTVELEHGVSLGWDDVIDLADEFAQRLMNPPSTP
jgi:tetratricopeptide (TPR) repeat protein